MSEHRYDIRISESCVDPNPLMVERQDPDNFTRFQTRDRCALEIAAYVFDLCMEESTCHEMVTYISQRFNSILCSFVSLFHQFLHMIFTLTLKE